MKKQITNSFAALVFTALCCFSFEQVFSQTLNCQATFVFQIDQSGLGVQFTNTSLQNSTFTATSSWNFGDGTSSNDKNPFHAFTVAGAYHVCLTITAVTPNGVLCTHTRCDTVRVGVNPPQPCHAAFTTSPNSTGLNVVFQNNSTPNVSGTTVGSSHWNFGDGTFSQDRNPQHAYNAAGVYWVCLTITVPTTPTGPVCTSTFCDSVRVGPNPQPICNAAFTTSPNSTGLNVVFQNNSTPNVSGTTVGSSHWNFGDGTFSQDRNPQHAYNAAGVYWVCLTITVPTSAGAVCTSTFCDSVRVGPNTQPVCHAAFTTSPNSTGLNVVFQNNSTPNVSGTTVYSSQWSFGDGSTSQDRNPQHTYNIAGVYWVCLTITVPPVTPMGPVCTSTFCDSVRVGPNTQPTCHASFTTTSNSLGLNVVFQNTSTPVTSSGTPGFSSTWTFGDGSTSQDKNPQHLYNVAGRYRVCLTITVPATLGQVACTSTFCDSITVAGNPPCINPALIDPNMACITLYAPVCGCNGVTYSNDCVARFHHGVTTWTQGVCPGQGCQATFSSHQDPAGFGVQFNNTSLVSSTPNMGSSWSFGDGTTSSDRNPHHFYQSPGTYYVCLTITAPTSNGVICTSTRCDSVRVINSGQPGCQASYTFQHDPNTLGGQFTNTSIVTTATLGAEWDFGDGTTSTDLNPHHVFSASGVYYVCLKIRAPFSGAGCVDSYCDSIRVGFNTPCVNPVLVNPNCICPAIYAPVCGCNNVTYGNSCEAQCNGVTHWSSGSCPGQGCQASFSFQIGTTGLSVQFNNTSLPNSAPGTVYSSNWNFGDGTTSTDKNPIHTFTAAGKYYVCLTISVVNSNGSACTSTFCDSVRVGLNTPCINPAWINPNCLCPQVYAPVCGCDGVTYSNDCHARCNGVTQWTPGPCGGSGPCQANFVWSYGIVPPTVFFSSTSTGNVISYLWNFGDGTTSTNPNPSHNFPNTGNYVVCLTIVCATSPTGPVFTTTFCDTIIAPGGNNCKDPSLINNQPCPLIYQPVCGCDSVTYTNSCVAQHRHGVASWTPGPCHRNCNANFTWQHCIDCPIVFFTNTSTGNYTQVKWDFGDGTASTTPNPQHTYMTTGRYRVCVTVWDAQNTCYDTFCDSVTASGCVNTSLINNLPCPTVYQPVCGCDGRTYANICEAERRGGIVSFFTTPGPCPGSGYCPSQGLDSNIAWISRVGPNFSGDNGGYAHFNYCNRILQAGKTYVLRVNGTVNNPSTGFQAHWRMWIDFNHDFDFNDPGELVWQGFGNLNQNAVFTVPNYACSGCTRMRVQFSSQFTNACGSYAVGETEDYEVRIRGNVTCNNPPFMPAVIHKTNDGDDDTGDGLFADLYEELSFRLYPNPADEATNVSLQTDNSAEKVTIKLVDISGRELYKTEWSDLAVSTVIQIPTQDIANGLYQVVVTSDLGYRRVEKLVIAR